VTLIKTFDFECYELGVYETTKGAIRLGGCWAPAEEIFSRNSYIWTKAAGVRMIEAILARVKQRQWTVEKIGAGAFPNKMLLHKHRIKIGCVWADDSRELRRWFRKHLGITQGYESQVDFHENSQGKKSKCPVPAI
jgi:hypothetical protein